jgi:Tol biopolymer transport system component
MNRLQTSLLGAGLVAAACANAPAPTPTPTPTTAPPPTMPRTPTNPHAGANPHAAAPVADRDVVRADEPHLKNLRMLTHGGENAEAYFDKTGTELIFQSKRDGAACDAIFRMTKEGENQRQVSPPLSKGGGRTTCSYIKGDGSILYASTHGHGGGCLDEPDRSQGYVWKVYPEFDIWVADKDGNNPKVLYASDGYDAEATLCHQDDRVVFTSSKSGDLELWMMNGDGSAPHQLTTTPGYDGGAFFSEDCTKMVWRGTRHKDQAKIDDDARLLQQSLVRPTTLEIFVADVTSDDTLANVVQVTDNGKANFAPYFHPDNKRVLYVSNKADPRGRDFDIYLVNIDGSHEERITTNPSFDGFPMFTPDGKQLVFSSNRANATPGDTNVFLADWVE